MSQAVVHNVANAFDGEPACTLLAGGMGYSGQNNMPFVDDLLQNNRHWADAVKRHTPDFFLKLSQQQTPLFFWIGCCDSRVPANQITGLLPGEVFVHRNIANIVNNADMNCMAALQYAVDILRVQHVILCGHYGCGGVQAAVHDGAHGMIDYWIWDIKALITRHNPLLAMVDEEQWVDLMCELNVIEQSYELCLTKVIREAWERGQPVQVHGWIYGIDDGLLQEVIPKVSQSAEVDEAYQKALVTIRQKYINL